MIFISKNEAGESACKLIKDGIKTVTRRYNIVEPGKIRAVQPGRMKKAVCHIEIISCMPHVEWDAVIVNSLSNNDIIAFYEDEAHREGFQTWAGLNKWFLDRHQDIDKTNRIEFRLVD